MLAANRKNVTMGPAPEKSHGIAGKKKVETLKDNFSLTGELFPYPRIIVHRRERPRRLSKNLLMVIGVEN